MASVNNENTPAPSEKKSHRCPSCGKNFSRQDHLRRHSLSHTGGKPHSCLFCRRDFARSDRLRDHYADCPARGNREIPKKTQRGRRRRACAACTASKLRCDGGIPCSCCQRRNLDCDVSRVNQQQHTEPVTGVPNSLHLLCASDSYRTEDAILAYHSPAVSESSDTSSIKALIDGGTRGFIESFNLPRVSDVEAGASSTPMPSETTEGDFSSLPGFEHHMELGFHIPDMLEFPAHVADLWVGPPGHELTNFAEHCDSHPAWSGNFTAAQFFHSSDLEPLDFMQGDKPDSLQVALLKDMMLRKAREMHPDPTHFDEVSTIIQSLFCQTKVDGFVRLFFTNFYHNCPIFHIPTFDADAITTELLLAIICFGAMYAHDGTDKLVADRLLDIAEPLVFSTELFAGNYEGQFESKEEADPDDMNREWKRFEQLQAAYLIVTVQYWAGARSSKARMMESRFGDIVKAARKTGLTHIRRIPQDRISEKRWIRKEIKLRTMCMIRSLDCAFLFYSNYPCRLTLSELNVDLPCDGSVFNSEHPFAEEDFCFSRSGNLAAVFDELFSEHTPFGITGTQAEESPHDSDNTKSAPNTRKTQTVLDLFLSIHLLYVFAHTHTQLRRFIPRSGQQKSAKPASGQESAINGYDEITTAVYNALKRWHMLCSAVRSNADATLSNSGLYKLSYNFWLIIHLFVDKGKSLDLAKTIDVQGEDKLILLKSIV